MPKTALTEKRLSSAEPVYSKGLADVVAAETSLSLVDGEHNKLFYRGIQVSELVEASHYEEVVFLLWNGRLPKAKELADFKNTLKQYRRVDSALLKILRGLPKTSHPMGVLRTIVSALGLFDAEADSQNLESNRVKAFRLTGSLPTLISAFYRIRQGKEPMAPDSKLSHAANFYFMMHGKTPEREMEKALDAYMILLADHGLNASTFSARVTVATQSDMYSAVTSAIGTLKGDLHGSANQRVMEMILAIAKPEGVEPYIRDLLARKVRVMGFGHRVYKKQDPRAAAFREIAERLCEKSGDKTWMEISHRIEKILWEEKKLPCNVDFFSATVLYILGFPVDFFTTVFAASRMAGWCAHVIEQLSDNRLIRPKAIYKGPSHQHYLPVNRRK